LLFFDDPDLFPMFKEHIDCIVWSRTCF